MKKIITIFLIMTPVLSIAQDISGKIISLEKAALERWNNGDPSGFLEISAHDVVYFDPFLDKRLDGHEKLTKLYETIRGKIKVTKYEMLNPKVQAVKDMAVLTFNLVSYSGDDMSKWNCTEVYRLEKNRDWKIIQTHWSLTQPKTQQD